MYDPRIRLRGPEVAPIDGRLFDVQGIPVISED